VTRHDENRDRLGDLAIARLDAPLTPAEQQELDALRGRYPDIDVESIERSAAALHVALLADGEGLPAALRARLLDAVDRSALPSGVPGSPQQNRTDEPKWALARYAGWAVAATLLVALAALLLRPPPPRVATTAQPNRAPVEISKPAMSPSHAVHPEARSTSPGATLDVAAARLQLLHGGQPVVQRAWVAGPDPTAIGMTGDVVWDAKLQRGFMSFRGLRPNSPVVEQYQLWIFDGQRDERYPVDGGVFNIDPNTGVAVISIRPALRITNALKFVVTLERPGGVVVSDRSHVVAIADVT